MTRNHANILDQIGNTPLIPIRRLNPTPGVEILAKLEFFNPGGSVKDRPALYMIEKAEEKGELTPDKIILEATSGNTGIGLALVAAVKGYKIVLTMSEAVSQERVRILKALGAEVRFTPSHLGTDGAIEYVYKLVREEPERYWLADQYNNEANWLAHYEGTAVELWEQTGGDVDAVVATMGTGGTLMGLSRRFQELHPEVRIIGVEPYLGHKIQGLKNMKESYRPGIFERERLHRVVHVDDEEAFETARLLAKKEGIFAGMSSGAAVAGALRIASEMEKGRIVAIVCDTGERYLSTALFMAKKKSGLRLYNTLSRSREEVVPIEEDRISMYTCGPTLCRHLRLGQARRLLLADLLRRHLELKGYQVDHTVSLTDLDDRTIEGAEAAGKELKEFTDRFFEALMEDLETLNIRKGAQFPRASENVEDMIQLARQLLEKGYAYEKFHSIYFDISRFRAYGKLSRIDLDKIRLGKTVDLDQYEKVNPRDFTLLKRSTLSELKKGIFHQTQWGNVRPSWHLECAAVAMKYLGPAYDIHTSGVDLIFPHNENTIAVSEAVNGRAPANYWVHNELVTVQGKKPSRDPEAESPAVRDLLELGYTGRELRYWILSHHYRKPLDFSRSELDGIKKTIANLDHFVRKLYSAPSAPPYPDLDQVVYDLRHRFSEAMDDDLNVSAALAALFRFTNRINKVMDAGGIDQQDRNKVVKALGRVNSVLAVLDLEVPRVSRDIEAIVEEREAARKERDWGKADRLRDRLKAMGIEVLDTREGPIWRRLDG